MTKLLKDAAAVRAIRDRLRSELDQLDQLGEQMAAIELNSAIEILNSRLGEEADADEAERLLRRHFDH